MDAQPGDFFAFLPGPAYSHSLQNTGASETLRYLCTSTRNGVDVIGYPDSGCERDSSMRLL